MIKNQALNYFNRMGKVRLWQLFSAFIIFSMLFVYGLRVNNNQMGELKKIVIAADEQGEGVYEALTRLANHVFHHMNTSTEINLNGEYQRAVDEAVKNAYSVSGNQQLYDEAIKECNKPGLPSVVRVACVQEYVEDHAKPGQGPQEPQLPLTQDYSHEFVAPTWSFDFAGFNLLATIFTAGWIAERLIRMKIQSKNPY